MLLILVVRGCCHESQWARLKLSMYGININCYRYVKKSDNEGFPYWEEAMDSWGYKFVSAVEAVAEMAAIGFGLPKDAFTGLLKNGPHFLSPTGGDLGSHGKEDFRRISL